MIMALKEALKDRDVSKSLVNQFRGECKEIVDESRREIKEKVKILIKEVDNKAKIQDDRISTLEKWADSTEQENRNNNMVIRGLNTLNIQNEKELASYVATTISRKLDIKLLPEDIRFAIALGKEKNSNRPVKVYFMIGEREISSSRSEDY